MSPIARSLLGIRERISAAERRYDRVPGSVALLAVSKTQSPEAVREAMAAGLTAFGENQLQDAMTKITALAERPPEWHFIGPIQSNKTRAIATHFAWVHSVDRLKIARRLSEQRPEALPPLNVCVQVNISDEATKSGVSPERLEELVGALRELPRLRLRGLMAIPRPASGLDRQRAALRPLAAARAALARRGIALDTLSMGMTADLEAAVAEGATIVRIGTALFGPRRQHAA